MRFYGVLLFLWACGGSLTAAAGSGDYLESSQRQALAVLDAGLDALGGRERVAAIPTLRYVAEVVTHRYGQAATPEEEGSSPPRTLYFTWSRDLPGERWILDVAREADAEPDTTIVWSEQERFVYRRPQNVIHSVGEFEAFLEPTLRGLTFAPELLLDAWGRAGSLRYLGTHMAGDSRQAVITYVNGSGSQVALSFDASNGRLLLAETREEHPQFGDMTQRVAFDDYREISGMHLPLSARSGTGPFPELEVEGLALEIGVAFDASRLARPVGARPASAPSELEQRIDEIVPGIYQIMNIEAGYHVTFVAQDKRVTVFEAPGGPATSRQVLGMIREIVPDAEIEMFVLTHHHFDHSAGLFTYIAAGIPIALTPGNEPFVREVAAATRGGQRPQWEPQLCLVDGRRSFGSGPNRFELIDVGPNPHAKEILIAYFPEHKLVYVPDVYGYLPDFTPAPLLRAFADRMDDLDLDVDTFATAHTQPTSLEKYRKMVRAAREATGG